MQDKINHLIENRVVGALCLQKQFDVQNTDAMERTQNQTKNI